MATDVLIVQSSRHSGYNEALLGFMSTCTAGSRTIVLEDYAENDLVRIAREEQPAVILTIGDAALTAVKKVRRIPIVSVMALNLPSGKNIPANVTGVSMTIAPERYMTLFKKLRVNRVGVIFSPKRSGGYVKRARLAAERTGVELVVREVRNPRQAMQQLATLKGNIDSLWLLPDSIAMTKETMDAFFFFAIKEGKPIIAFSEIYLSYGAAAAIEIDRYAMGSQAGEIANRMLAGVSPAGITVDEPQSIYFKTNHSVLRKLGISYSE